MLISDSYPNLINGVSQQAEALRLNSQVEALENAVCSVVDGLHKRQPTQHIAKLATGDHTGAFTHLINRDSTEQYIVMIESGTTSGSIRVFNLAGVEQTVSTPDGTGYLSVASTSVPSFETFRAETLADTTFIVNREKTVAMAGTTTAAAVPACLIWVRQGLVGHTYVVELEGGPRAIFSDAVSTLVKTMDVANAITSQLRSYMAFQKVSDNTYVTENNVSSTLAVSGTQIIGNMISTPTVSVYASFVLPADVTIVAGHKVLVSDNAIRVRAPATDLYYNAVSDNLIFLQRIDGSDFVIKVYDSYGDQALTVIKDKVQLFSDLPSKAFPGMIIQVAGADASEDDYWVEFIPDSVATFGKGSWSETVGPSVRTTLSAATMPFILQRTAPSTFTFQKATWGLRTAGDETSAPNPSFVGATINDVFTYRGRLGFLSGTHVCLSQAGSFFNFFPTTVTTLLDDSRIDYRVGGEQVSNLYHAIPFQDQLLLFSDQSQLTLSQGESLTQKTVAVTATTFFESVIQAKPVNSGASVFFGFTRGNYSGMREYFVQGQSRVNDAADVTAHVPRFIEGEIRDIRVSTALNSAVVLSDTGSNSAWLYQWLWSENTKVQSAWNKWTFDGDPVCMYFVGEVLYALMQRSTGLFLEKLELTNKVDDDSDFVVYLDRRTSDITPISYVEGGNYTTFSVPYHSEDMQAVTKAGGVLMPLLANFSDGGNYIRVRGDQMATPIFVGIPYTFTCTMTRPFMKVDAKAGGIVAVSEGRLQVSEFLVRYADTGYFKLTVEPDRYNTFVQEFTGRYIGSSHNVIGEVALEDGVYKVPIRSRNEEMVLTLSNDTHMPCFFLSAEWLGMYNPKTRRV